MTTTSLPRYPGRQRVTQARVIRSEWIKLRTQLSALWSLASAVILIIAFGVLYSLLREARPPQGAVAIQSFDPVSVSLSGVELAQIATGVLGVLVITSEYATGLIRTTLAAVPRRLPVLWGKAAMVAVATIAVTLPAALAAFLAGQSVLSRHHLDVSLGHPVEGEAEPVRQAIAAAHEEAILALSELREFIRGLHPAVLGDRGLNAALSGLVARAPLPVQLRVNVPRPAAPGIEAVAYFVVSEALTNVVKHAKATSAEVTVTRAGDLLRIVVSDDGTGGAVGGGGTGLRGLAQRAAAVDGTLSIDSPPGGPTVITAELPCES